MNRRKYLSRGIVTLAVLVSGCGNSQNNEDNNEPKYMDDDKEKNNNHSITDGKKGSEQDQSGYEDNNGTLSININKINNGGISENISVNIFSESGLHNIPVMVELFDEAANEGHGEIKNPESEERIMASVENMIYSATKSRSGYFIKYKGILFELRLVFLE